jgi:H+/Cl- antiporter ClcA
MTDALAALRQRSYLKLLLLAAVLGVPITIVAYGLLYLFHAIPQWVYTDLPRAVGLNPRPAWWPLLPMVVAGLVVGAVIRYLPGKGGSSPADGFHTGGPPRPRELFGIALAAVAGIGLGAVVGPEAPLIALGAGLAHLAVWLRNRNMPQQAEVVVAATGSFAAVSTLLGSPLTGAFLLMEVIQVGGATATVVLVPGLLGAGIGALVFVGIGTLTGLGTFSLAIPTLPTASHPTWAELVWAVALGLVAAPLGWALRRLALLIRPYAQRRVVLATPALGVVIALLAIGYSEWSGHPADDVLFSGEFSLAPLIESSAAYSVGALLLLLVCKGLAYSVSLASFRGGPTFPALFLGATGGIAAHHLPGLPLTAGVAIGMAAMAVAVLRLPLTSVLITTLFLGSSGITVMPLVIIAVVVSFVTVVRMTPPARPADPAEPKAVSSG